MKSMQRVGTLGVVVVLLTAWPILAGTEGRVVGTVVDPDGNPIDGVLVTLTGVGFEHQSERTTNKKGKFTLLVLDATQEYTLKLEKEGFQTIAQPFKISLGETMRESWTLIPGSGGGGPVVQGPAVIAPSAEAGRGQAARLYEDGVEAFEAGELDEARTAFTEVLALEPELAEAHQALAMTLIRQENYAEAIDAAESVLQLRAGDVLALRVQHEAYRALGDKASEERLVDALVQYDSGPDTARVVFNSGVSHLKEGNLEAGAVRFEQARTMDPELTPAYAALARVYFDLDRLDESVAMAEHVLAREPNNADVLGVLYLIYEQRGQTAEAEAAFGSLKAVNPEYVGKVLLDLGLAYFNAGDTARAQTLFERVLDAQPNHAKAHYFMGLCLASTGEMSKAKEMLKRFIELAPDDPDAAIAREMLPTL